MAPLHCAAMDNDNAAGIHVLASAGAELDARNSAGSTPRHFATVNGVAPVVQALISAGADPTVMIEDDATPLHCAAMSSHANVDVVRTLVAAGADPTAQIDGSVTTLDLAIQTNQKMKIVRAFAAAAAERLGFRQWLRVRFTRPWLRPGRPIPGRLSGRARRPYARPKPRADGPG